MRTWRVGSVVMVGVLLFAGSGCGRAAKLAEDESSAEASADEESPVEAGTSAKPKKKKKKTVQVPNLGGIPLDAFGDEPVVAAAAAPSATPTTSKPETMSAPPAKEIVSVEPKKDAAKPEPTKPEPAKPAAAGGDEWPALLSGEVIAEETKKIRLRLKDSLGSVAKFNDSFKEVEVDGAEMAALAAILQSHPDSATWKPKAKFVRDVAASMGAAAKKGASKANYDPTQAEYEKLNGLLSGDSPAGVGEAADKVPFHEVAGRSPLMRRMEKAKDFLALNIKNIDALKKEKDLVVHEAHILAALTKVVGAEGYNNADEEEYKGFIQTIVKASLDAANAGMGEDFDTFHSAMEKVKTACEQCHKDYRFGSN